MWYFTMLDSAVNIIRHKSKDSEGMDFYVKDLDLTHCRDRFFPRNSGPHRARSHRGTFGIVGEHSR